MNGNRPAPFRRVYVDRATDLAPLADELAQHGVIGVDCEMGQRVQRRPGGVQEWVHILALIQIAGGDLSVVVDPLRCSVDALAPLLAGSTRKVFLGGGQDAALLEKAGIPTRNVVDVGEIALALFGHREDGMAALAQRIFGLSLDKTVRRADWMVRPLDPVLVAYAHRDAELTLMIYQWFAEHYPAALAMHERRYFDPGLSGAAPEWLRDMVSRPTSDALAVAMEHGLTPEADGEQMAAAVRVELRGAGAPRLINRLLRLGADLQLKPLLPDVLPYTESLSSMLRGSAARAVGHLSEPEEGIPLLEQLAQDPLDDVKKAAQAALRDLRAPKVTAEPDEEEAQPQLDDNAMAALLRLKASLEAADGRTE